MVVTLIGFMGSGKSSIGRRLADMLGWPLIDLDDYIVDREGSEITEIFAEHGEEHFRALELRYLSEIISQYETAIVPLGGGTPCQGEAWPLINQTTSIYLQRSVKSLFKNLKNKKAKRPLIKQLSDDELKEFIAGKLDAREEHYEKAAHIVQVLKSKKKVAKDIIANLSLTPKHDNGDVTVSERIVLSSEQKEQARELWNTEYPDQLEHTTMATLQRYFDEQKILKHYWLTIDKELAGWAFTFIRDGGVWFGILVNRDHQSSGCGTRLMERIMSDHDDLTAWVIDHENYRKTDGTTYQSPLPFYIKLGFSVLDERYTTFMIDAIKIHWRK